MKKILFNYFYVLLLLILQCNFIFAQYSSGTAFDRIHTPYIDVFLHNSGTIWNETTGKAYHFPSFGVDTSLSTRSVISGGGICMGAKDNSGALHLSTALYQTDYSPGPLNDTGFISVTNSNLWDRIFFCYSSEIATLFNERISTGLPIPLARVPANIKQWPAKGNTYLASIGIIIDRDMAPFNDYNRDGIYNPELGDLPCIKGDEACFYVINDAGHPSSFGGQKLGVDIKVLAYTFKNSNYLQFTSFYEIKVQNRSLNNYHDYYFGFIVDPDLGCFQDDYVGCTIGRNLGICYGSLLGDNACSGGYGLYPPILGVDMLHTPKVSGTEVGMTSFNYFNNSPGINGSPLNATNFWNRLNGYWNNGATILNTGEGLTGTDSTKFCYPGNPSDASSWSEFNNQTTGHNTSGDRAFVMSSGPYSFNRNQELEFDFAVMTRSSAVGEFPYPNFNNTIHLFDDSIQYFYDFELIPCANDSSTNIVNPINENSNIISISPNPINNQQIILTHQDVLKVGYANFKISDMNGRILYNKNNIVNSNQSVLDIMNLNLLNGLYLLQINQNEKLYHLKFMIQN